MVVMLLSYAFLHVSVLLGLSFRRHLFAAQEGKVDEAFHRYRVGRVVTRRGAFRAFLQGYQFLGPLHQVRVHGTAMGLLVYENIPAPVLMRRRAMLIPWECLNEAEPTTLPWFENPLRRDAVKLNIVGTASSLVMLTDTWRHVASLSRNPGESEDARKKR
jgi:hypothetical protein